MASKHMSIALSGEACSVAQSRPGPALPHRYRVGELVRHALVWELLHLTTGVRVASSDVYPKMSLSFCAHALLVLAVEPRGIVSFRKAVIRFRATKCPDFSGRDRVT